MSSQHIHTSNGSGVGTGENLNEHVTGVGWPPVDVRREMLAIEAPRRGLMHPGRAA
jgi:hypothetical protein